MQVCVAGVQDSFHEEAEGCQSIASGNVSLHVKTAMQHLRSKLS